MTLLCGDGGGIDGGRCEGGGANVPDNTGRGVGGSGGGCGIIVLIIVC